MEASGNPPPSDERAAEPATPPPPPPAPAPAPAATDDGKAGAGWRVLAVVLGLALAFAALVMILVPLNPDDTPRCEQLGTAGFPLGGECYDLTSSQQTIQNILSWPAGIIGAAASLLAFYFAATGRRGDLLLRLTGIAIVFGVAALIVGQV